MFEKIIVNPIRAFSISPTLMQNVSSLSRRRRMKPSKLANYLYGHEQEKRRKALNHKVIIRAALNKIPQNMKITDIKEFLQLKETEQDELENEEKVLDVPGFQDSEFAFINDQEEAKAKELAAEDSKQQQEESETNLKIMSKANIVDSPNEENIAQTSESLESIESTESLESTESNDLSLSLEGKTDWPYLPCDTGMAFKSFGLHEKIIQVLEKFKLDKPFEIQELAFPHLLKRRSCVLGAETGSGKTLAYLLPLIHLMGQDKWEDGIFTRKRQPRAVIFVPTRDLGLQIFGYARRLAEPLGLTCVALFEGCNEKKNLKSEVDMVITSPGRYLDLMREELIHCGDVKYMIVDEADTMFEKDFGEDLDQLYTIFSAKDKPKKLEMVVLVSATISDSMKRVIKNRFPSMKKITTENIHRTVPKLRQQFFEIDGGSTAKMEYILNLIARNPGHRMMIFCNNKSHCDLLHNYLREHRVDRVGVLHGGVKGDERQKIMLKLKLKELNFVICTDIASRGIDIKDINHVVMFDFPRNAIEYLHRAGRTARAGYGGRVTSLIGKKDTTLAKYIKLTVTKKLSFHEMTESAIKVPCLEESRKKVEKIKKGLVQKRMTENEQFHSN